MSVPIDLPDVAVTGVSAAGADGTVTLFIESASMPPTRMLKRGNRIFIAAIDRILNDAVYGALASAGIDTARKALVVEVADGGAVTRVTTLALED